MYICLLYFGAYGDHILSSYLSYMISFKLNKDLIASWFLILSICCFGYKSPIIFTRGAYLKELFEFEWRGTYFISTHVKLLACQSEFDSPWTEMECCVFKPPQYLQACIKNLMNGALSCIVRWMVSLWALGLCPTLHAVLTIKSYWEQSHAIIWILRILSFIVSESKLSWKSWTWSHSF